MVLSKKYFHKYIPAWNILRFSQKWQAFCDQREGTSSRTTNEKKRSADEIPEGEETQQGSSQTPIGRGKARKLGKLQSTPPTSGIDLSLAESTAALKKIAQVAEERNTLLKTQQQFEIMKIMPNTPMAQQFFLAMQQSILDSMNSTPAPTLFEWTPPQR